MKGCNHIQELIILSTGILLRNYVETLGSIEAGNFLINFSRKALYHGMKELLLYVLTI
jgi:hypothetical protein